MKEHPFISVIIPTYNEKKTIQGTLEHLRKWEKQCEVIVSDGGSTDGTRELVFGDVKLLKVPSGRANQMNAGAEIATGEILLFLHSDTRLPPDVMEQLVRASMNKEIVGGAFKVKFDHPGLFFYLASLGSNLRAKLTGIFFGDQAIFARRSVFQQIGGFPAIELMEDWELSLTLRKLGKTILLQDRLPHPQGVGSSMESGGRPG